MGMQLHDLLGPGIAAAVSGGFGYLMWMIQRDRHKAEIKKLNAETGKIEAEVGDIVTSRLIRELSRISAVNEQQALIIENQRKQIEELRAHIEQILIREANNSKQNAELLAELAALKTQQGASFHGSDTS